MLHEQQTQQQHLKMRMDVKRRLQERKRAPVEEERLQVVDLSGMSLETLPNPPLSIGTICKLDLSNNNLQSIPESATARMLHLIVLDVHSNQLKSLPNSIGCLSKLKVLNVSGNLLESLPKTIEDCRSLEDLNANFNKLTKLPDTIGFELVNLKKLSVNSNKLVFLPHSITHLTNLQVLDARLNCLRSLPEDLENLINLQVLNISQNFQYLTTLPYSLGLLMSLVELDVSYNRIAALPESLSCLRKIQKLSVEGNPLVSPPAEVFEHGINAVMEYLSEKMSGGAHKDHSPNNKKRWWFGKFKKFSTFNGRRDQEIRSSSEGLFNLPKYHPIEGIASPRYVGGNNVASSPKHMGMFSPLRLFSPKSYCTR